MNNWKEFRKFNFKKYDVSNKNSCLQLYTDLNKIGFYADQISKKMVTDNNIYFFRHQLFDISSALSFDKFDEISIGNFAISLTILEDDDLELKKDILMTLKNYQFWFNKNYNKHSHCLIF